MTLVELLNEYKGEINVNLNQITDEGTEPVISFKNTEVESLKDTLLNATVANFTVEVSSKMPVTASLSITVKEPNTTAASASSSGGSSSGTASTGSSSTTAPGTSSSPSGS